MKIVNSSPRACASEQSASAASFRKSSLFLLIRGEITPKLRKVMHKTKIIKLIKVEFSSKKSEIR
jgi:hypothetical protein